MSLNKCVSIFIQRAFFLRARVLIREKRAIGPYLDKESRCCLVWRKLQCVHCGKDAGWMILCKSYLFTLPVTTLNSCWPVPLYWNLRSNVIAADSLLEMDHWGFSKAIFLLWDLSSFFKSSDPRSE